MALYQTLIFGSIIPPAPAGRIMDSFGFVVQHFLEASPVETVR